MPINPNIALSFKPTYELESPQNIEANVMKLQGAKYANELARMQSQEYARGLQEQEGLRNYLAGRPDLSSQEARSELTRYGKPGSDVLKAQDERIKAENEATKANQDIVKSELELNQRALDKIHYPEEYSAYIDKTYENKILKQYLEANGITKEQALKKFNDVVATGPTEFKYYLDEQKMGMKSHRDMLRQQEQGQTGLAKLLNEQARYAPGSPEHAWYQKAITNYSDKTPTIYQQGQLDVANKGLELKQQEAARKAAGQDLKPVPTAAQKAITGSAAAIDKLDRAIKSIEEGPKEGATGLKGLLPDVALNRLYPEGTEGRANVSDIGSLVMHERSGAAVTASEAPRLKPFIPLITDDKATVLKKLRRMREIQAEEQDALLGTYNPEQGFREFKPASVTKPSAPGAPTVPKRDLKSMSNEDLLRELSKPNG